jgi:hypothetical protein
MFVLELAADDLYAVLGRFLDHARVAGLRLAAVSAHESAGRYTICATIATRDAERVERLARKLRTVAGVADVVIRQNQATQDPSRQDPSRQDQSPEQNQSRETETLLVS